MNLKQELHCEGAVRGIASIGLASGGGADVAAGVRWECHGGGADREASTVCIGDGEGSDLRDVGEGGVVRAVLELDGDVFVIGAGGDTGGELHMEGLGDGEWKRLPEIHTVRVFHGGGIRQGD